MNVLFVLLSFFLSNHLFSVSSHLICLSGSIIASPTGSDVEAKATPLISQEIPEKVHLTEKEAFADIAHSKSQLKHALDSSLSYVVKNLIEKKIVNPKYISSTIRSAASNGLDDVVKYLLSKPDVDPAMQNDAPLKQAIMNGHIQVVKLLMNDSRVGKLVNTQTEPHLDIPYGDISVERNAIGYTPARIAAEYGELEILRLLLSDSRFNRTKDIRQAFVVAARWGNTVIVKFEPVRNVFSQRNVSKHLWTKAS